MGRRKVKIMDTVDKVDYDKLIHHIIQWLDDNIDSAPMGSVGVATDSQDLKEKIVSYLEGLDEFG
jgi:hypothetical protein